MRCEVARRIVGGSGPELPTDSSPSHQKVLDAMPWGDAKERVYVLCIQLGGRERVVSGGLEGSSYRVTAGSLDQPPRSPTSCMSCNAGRKKSRAGRGTGTFFRSEP